VLGGLARRAQLLKNLQSQGGPCIAVDSGDLFFDPAADQADVKKALTKARLIAQAYRVMGVAAVNVGGRDLSQGLDFLKQEAAQGLPLISANLVDAVQKKLLFSPYVIREVSGTRIAFVGLLRTPLPPASEKSLAGKAEVQDPMETARKVMAELQGKADLICLLSDLGWDRDIGIAKEITGIQFILGGHDGRATLSPFQQGETFIMQSYQKGMYAGELALPLEKAGSLFQDEGRITRIQEELAALDRRSRDLEGAKGRDPQLDIKPAMEGIKQQKDKLQKELKEAQKAAAQSARFRWTLEPISSSLDEDAEVRSLIEASGVKKD
jgi:2',3'-cyclic-nucleotide 2'-phosphodiesterase (5'-nucleotidase family)